MNETAHPRSPGALVRLVAYLRLCRPDAPAIAFLGYLVGVRLAGQGPGPAEVGIALLVAGVSTNFVYSLNSVTDWREDALSRPQRPIPAGLVSHAGALRYAVVLLVLALLYPLLVARSAETLGLFLLLPLLGLVYSAPPIRLRRFPVVAVLVICTGLVTPVVLGYRMSGGDWSRLPFFASLYLFCLGAVPLKAVDERLEDEASGVANLYRRFSSRLLLCSATVLAADALLAALALAGRERLFVLVAAGGALACLALYSRRPNPEGVYQAIINTVVAAGALFLALLLVA